MNRIDANPIEDLEALLEPYATMPEQPVWLPISLFTMQNRGVAVAVVPKSRGKVVVTDQGETLNVLLELGLEVKAGSALLRDITSLASRRGFRCDGWALSRVVSPAEVPTAALHLAELQIAVSGLLHIRYEAQSSKAYSSNARKYLIDHLRPNALKLVKFGADYTGEFEDGKFFCVAEAKQPVGVKLVTDETNLRDAVIAGLLFEKSPIELAALRKPDFELKATRGIQFTTMYSERIFNSPELLTQFLNRRLAG
jgi:hypothetical protein